MASDKGSTKSDGSTAASHAQDKKRPASATKCLRCLALSSKKEWCEDEAPTRSGGDANIPKGPSCRDCGDLHHIAFKHMSFPDFASACFNDPVTKANAAVAESVRRGRPPD